MHWLVGLLIVVVALEFMAGYLSNGGLRKAVASLAGVIITVDTIFLIWLRPSAWTILLAYLSIFRVINILKLIDARKQADYLRSSFLRSSLMLSIYQLVVLGATWIIGKIDISFSIKWAIVVGLSLIGLIVIGMSLRRGLTKTRPVLDKLFTKESELPSITVAIPTRNETVDLEECLNSLIGSDYPKMEILVLDDCSQEKRTPEIIRSYAQDGVRFLSGSVPDESWTAKNYAYQQLAEEANGQVIVFCGVDTRFERQTIRKIIEIKLAKQKKMISFMPLNVLNKSKLSALMVQPVRYLWELGIPRRFLGRPPVLSSCWLIDRQQLMDCGSFKACSRAIIPERYFAASATKADDGYSFISLGKSLGLVSVKSFNDQLSTATRTKYPLLKQRLEHVAVLNCIEFLVFIAPIGLLIYELMRGNVLLAILSALCVILGSLIAFRITRLTYDKWLILSLIAFPIVIFFDICLQLYSMWQYEFSEVVWKGRNVCIPVMQITSAK